MQLKPLVVWVAVGCVVSAAPAFAAGGDGLADEEMPVVHAADDPNSPDFVPPNGNSKPAAERAVVEPKVVEIPQALEIPLIEPQRESYSDSDITYVTGGIGDDERELIESSRDDYNLQLSNARPNGDFVGEVRVVIRRQEKQGAREVLNTYSGPLLYARLPAGRYQLEATLGERKILRSLTIGRKGAPAILRLIWK